MSFDGLNLCLETLLGVLAFLWRFLFVWLLFLFILLLFFCLGEEVLVEAALFFIDLLVCLTIFLLCEALIVPELFLFRIFLTLISIFLALPQPLIVIVNVAFKPITATVCSVD